jgi:ankyrin repeat protein
MNTGVVFKPGSIGATTFAIMDILHSDYSREEIEVAKRSVIDTWDMFDFTSEQETKQAWELAHVLTSNDAWDPEKRSRASGTVHIVNEFLKRDVQHFFQRLLCHDTSLHMIDFNVVGDTTIHGEIGVMGYMVQNCFTTNDKHFLKMLRAHLYGFPSTAWAIGEVGEVMPDEYPGKTYADAVELSCCSDIFPVSTLKTLLEAGMLVDHPNENGDTAFMLAIYKKDGDFPSKARLLLQYGAKIDIYNLAFQNSLHIAVAGANIEGLCLVLDARKRRILSASDHGSSMGYGGLLQARGALDPDPLHQPDKDYETPLSIVINFALLGYDTRKDMIQLLIDAGASAYQDVERVSRIKAAYHTSTTPTASGIPPCYGMVNCQLIDADFEVFICMHKETYCTATSLDLEVLTSFIDMDKSVLPVASMTSPVFDAEYFFTGFTSERFEFDAGVDGLDFDIYFNAINIDNNVTYSIGLMDFSQYKLAIRFPRGPTLGNWTHGFRDDYVFTTNTVVYDGRTIAHNAVLCPDTELRKTLVALTRPLCNPLRRCQLGLTATETFERLLQGTVVDEETMRLVEEMRADQDTMTAYIHNAPDPSRRHGQPFKSAFHSLSDDLCRIIINFV